MTFLNTHARLVQKRERKRKRERTHTHTHTGLHRKNILTDSVRKSLSKVKCQALKKHTHARTHARTHTHTQHTQHAPTSYARSAFFLAFCLRACHPASLPASCWSCGLLSSSHLYTQHIHTCTRAHIHTHTHTHTHSHTPSTAPSTKHHHHITQIYSLLGALTAVSIGKALGANHTYTTHTHTHTHTRNTQGVANVGVEVVAEEMVLMVGILNRRHHHHRHQSFRHSKASLLPLLVLNTDTHVHLSSTAPVSHNTACPSTSLHHTTSPNHHHEGFGNTTSLPLSITIALAMSYPALVELPLLSLSFPSPFPLFSLSFPLPSFVMHINDVICK